jgi:hypothetical protein
MVLKTLSVADQLVETREFSRFSKNRNVRRLVTLRRIIDFEWWILNFEWWIGGPPSRFATTAGQGKANFGFWLNGALRLNLGAARPPARSLRLGERSAPTL